MRYVSLHHHTTFSYMDGFGTPEQHVARAVELEMPALALTEHGNVSSHVRLEKAARAAGIKPIFGCELYVAPEKTRQKFHQTVLAMNPEGYRNLNRVVTRSWQEGFYQWPTAHPDILADHTEGLVITSGCSDSLLSCTLLGGKSLGEKRDTVSRWEMDEAERVIRRYQEFYGTDTTWKSSAFQALSALGPLIERLRSCLDALAPSLLQVQTAITHIQQTMKCRRFSMPPGVGLAPWQQPRPRGSTTSTSPRHPRMWRSGKR